VHARTVDTRPLEGPGDEANRYHSPRLPPTTPLTTNPHSRGLEQLQCASSVYAVNILWSVKLFTWYTYSQLKTPLSLPEQTQLQCLYWALVLVPKCWWEDTNTPPRA